jgi:DNA-binding SARP family transcriptional activator
VLLVGIDTRRGEYLLRDARRLAEGDRGDPAWQHMLRGPGQLTIKILGEASAFVDGLRAPFKTRAEMELVAMLALAGAQGLKTDEIADRLWPDLDWDRVNHRVDNLISSTRRSLLPTTRLDRQRGVVTLDLDDSECDATMALAEARRLLEGGRERRLAQHLAERLRTPLLGGPTAMWVDAEQARLGRVAARLDLL